MKWKLLNGMIKIKTIDVNQVKGPDPPKRWDIHFFNFFFASLVLVYSDGKYQS